MNETGEEVQGQSPGELPHLDGKEEVASSKKTEKEKIRATMVP